MKLEELSKTIETEVKKLERVPGKVQKRLGAEVKKLEQVPGRVRRQLEGEVGKVRKQVDAELKKLDRVRSRLIRQLEALPTRAADVVGIARASQVRSLRAELSKLSKRVDALKV